MRLAYITRAYPFADLGETFLAPEIRALSGMADELHVIPARPNRSKRLPDAYGNTAIVHMGLGSAAVAYGALAECFAHPARTARAFFQLLLPRYRLSAKIKNLAVFPKALAVARYLRRNGIDHVHAHWLTTPATVAYVASMLTDIPWSCTAHAHDIFSDNLLEQKVGAARFVRAIAQRNLEDLAHLAGRAADSLHLIHVGVDLPGPAARQVQERPLQVLCAARLDPIKGHEYLIRALAVARERRLPFHCDIVGNGPAEAHVRSLVRDLGLDDCVTLRGMVPHSELLAQLGDGRYDVLVLPSVEFSAPGQHEGIPVALIEAMASGMACVASRTGCIPELVDDATGILAPQRDPDALARALLLLWRDRELRSSLGTAARARVVREYDIRATAAALYGLIRGSDGPFARAANSCAAAHQPGE